MCLDFTSFVKTAYIERLAETDQCELVKSLIESYGDVYALSRHVFSLNIDTQSAMAPHEALFTWQPKALQRAVEGLSASLLALKRRPMIRYYKGSQMAAAVASQLSVIIGEEQKRQFSDLRQLDPLPVVLVLDRRQDMVTPLLRQWTFEAMIHDLLGLRNGRVKFSDAKGKQIEMVLADAGHDAVGVDLFYATNRLVSYGQLGERVQSLVREYEQRAKAHQSNVSASAGGSSGPSIAEMKRFVEEYPEWRRQGEAVAKYVALACALQEQVDKRGLLAASEAEQLIATASDPSFDLVSRAFIVSEPDGTQDPRTRAKLGLLFALKFNRQPGFNWIGLQDFLLKNSVSADDVALIDYALKLSIPPQTSAGPAVSPGAQQADDTVYTQHQAPMLSIVDRLLKGKLSSIEYPVAPVPGQSADPSSKPTDIIVFVCNGGAYEEVCQVERLMERNWPHARLIYGCTTFLGSGELQSAVRDLALKSGD